jgi:Putative Ig domain
MYESKKLHAIFLSVALTAAANIAEARNHAPMISGSPATNVAAGKTYSFTPTAQDADGNMLHFLVKNRPSWASFSTTTGRLLGTPTNAQVGSYEKIEISVSDGRTRASLPQFSVTVKASATTPPPSPPPVSGSGRPDLGTNASLHGMQVFPASDPWNEAVDVSPVDANSATILGKIGASTPLHPDFGANYNGGPFGIPYIVVPDTQPSVPVTFDYADESDAGPYPIPPNPPIEPGDGDNHLLMITRDKHMLYELYGAHLTSGDTWAAGSGAIFDLINGTQRPPGWTSADAAGLPIFPGLVRYDEVVELGQINHALRFTVAKTRKAYIPPATHYASSSTDASLPPMGMRVRLKENFDFSGYPAQAQVILRALKKYGMIVADNGSNFYLSGTADARWNDLVLNALKKVTVGNFEVVQMQGVVTR